MLKSLHVYELALVSDTTVALYIYIYLFSFLTLISIFCICHALVNNVVCVMWKSVTFFFDFLFSQGSVATYCKWGRNICDVYIENFLTYHPVKEFWKSVHICQSYYQTSNSLLFWTLCRLAHCGGGCPTLCCRPRGITLYNVLVSEMRLPCVLCSEWHTLTNQRHFLSCLIMKVCK